MKKKGFTLVELLAVIVVLGIIMLIAIPKILGVIDNAKEGAFQSSSYGIVKAANYYCATKKLSDLTYSGSSFTATNGKLVNGEEELPVSDITLEGNSFVNVDENCNVQMSVTDGIYYATKEYDEAGVAVTLSEDAALTRDQMTQEIEILKSTVASLVDKNNSNNMMLKTYPVGSIYMSKESANPSTLFGGTWIAWGSGKVPVGVDAGQTEFNTIEKTGGEKTHTLTIPEMPSHTHAFTGSSTTTSWGGDHIHSTNIPHSDGVEVTAEYIGVTLYYGTARARYCTNTAGGHNHTAVAQGTNSNTGGGGSHNNLQPYITVYMWKRTA